MDTNVFRYVLEVDKCKNITLAAKHLFISQPALTKQLSKLEKELGFQLFDRAHTPITTTPQGELFLDFARRYQELEQDFQNDIALSRHTPAVPVRIATTHRGGGYAGIHTAAFMAAYPNICLEYLDTSARKCEELLEEEQVDLAIYTDPILSSKLEYMPLEEDPLVFVIPQSSPLLAGLDLSGNSLEHPVEIESRRFRDPSLRYILATPGQGLYYAENAFFKNIVSLHWTLSGWNTSIPATRSCRAVAASHCSRTPRSSSTLMATANRRFMASRKVTLYTATSSLPGKRAAPSPPMQKPSGVLW